MSEPTWNTMEHNGILGINGLNLKQSRNWGNKSLWLVFVDCLMLSQNQFPSFPVQDNFALCSVPPSTLPTYCSQTLRTLVLLVLIIYIFSSTLHHIRYITKPSCWNIWRPLMYCIIVLHYVELLDTTVDALFERGDKLN